MANVPKKSIEGLTIHAADRIEEAIEAVRGVFGVLRPSVAPGMAPLQYGQYLFERLAERGRPTLGRTESPLAVHNDARMYACSSPNWPDAPPSAGPWKSCKLLSPVM
jgi:hypothetical protein